MYGLQLNGKKNYHINFYLEPNADFNYLRIIVFNYSSDWWKKEVASSYQVLIEIKKKHLLSL